MNGSDGPREFITCFAPGWVWKRWKGVSQGSEVTISALFSYLTKGGLDTLRIYILLEPIYTESLLSQNQAVNAISHFPNLLSLPPVLCHILPFSTPPIFPWFFTLKKYILRTSQQWNLIKVDYDVSSAFIRTDRKILMEIVWGENLAFKSYFWSPDNMLAFHRGFSIFFLRT